MCKQSKTGHTGCAHVYADGDIELCAQARRPDVGEVCDEVETYWKNLKFPGKCIWCQQHDREKGMMKTSDGQSKPRPDWLK
ncbi:hypothetical protein PMIN06_009493 [Paraphaeosphaeria minitans]|uniref:Uncharacterized protein n=1 Tax=Paraphaeosphaeria minitans TaxID=565426 RepID=A0A9P6GBN8_9PLEO|nr:hypothetical protein PMIN01_09455 [Paraphaeosphaeria minitans]